MERKNIFISFDYDNDLNIKGCLQKQLQEYANPYDLKDISFNIAEKEIWKKKARSRIGQCNGVIILCGHYTSSAKGVTAELTIAQDLNIPYILLKGRKRGDIQMPMHIKKNDELLNWKKKNILKFLSTI